MARYREFDGTQIRHGIDAAARYRELRQAERLLAHRFAGSVSWKTVAGHRYLYRKRRGGWFSLGRESETTSTTHRRFLEGRAALKARIAALDTEIRTAAPLIRALGLGRVPGVAARILRRLDALGVLGPRFIVAGTHALFAYEQLAGVFFEEDVVATRDVDLLLDARAALDLVAAGADDPRLINLLRTADASFAPVAPGSFRAANDRGFMVDVIVPASRKRPATTAAHTPRRGDLAPAEIEGLAWLESTPRIDVVAFDERGFPVRLIAPDPRAFLAHKAWVAERDDREPVKRRRDHAQATAVAAMVAGQLAGRTFDARELSALPAALRARGARLLSTAGDTVTDWR